MNLDWLIIGGGIHGVHIASRLIGEAEIDPMRLRIVDPGERLLERWRRCTETTGMTHLRSPSVHHLDLDPWSLRNFVGEGANRKANAFAAPYDRPSLALFNEHCDQVIAEFGLSDLHVQSRAVNCVVGCDAIEIGLSDGGSLTAKNVVLAIGASEQPEWPAWAHRPDPRVHHVFDPEFAGWPSSAETVTVVGGGISAAQIALRLLAENHCVHLVSRHALRQHQFDSDPGWLGPKFMTGFREEKDADARRTLISDARHKGSVPPDVERALKRAIKSGQLHWHEAHVEGLGLGPDDLAIQLSTGIEISAQRVLLATGFAAHRPGGVLIEQLIEAAALPCAQCGYPIVDSNLNWHPRVYVSGPLAELELGPSARNIVGARRAADRLVQAARLTKTTSAKVA